MTINDDPSLYSNGQMIVRVDHTGNVFNLSALKDFEHATRISNCFAIKFVRDGIERYTINGKSYTITSGSYLLMNGEKEGTVVIDSDTYVKGMCLNISNELIAEVIATHREPDTPFSDPGLSNFFYTEYFLENQYQAPYTTLGRKLQQISECVNNNLFSNDQIDRELFYQLAESLVNDQISVFSQLQSITTVKAETQRDLCRRVLKGKEFVDASFTETLTIEQIARTAGMSEYHFFRLFKQMTGFTPYQYILSRRLQNASLLLKAEHSVLDTAIASGFSDIFTFSKAFKKHTGVSPKQYAASILPNHSTHR